MRSMTRCDAVAEAVLPISSNLVSCSIVNAAPPSVFAWRGCFVYMSPTTLSPTISPTIPAQSEEGVGPTLKGMVNPEVGLSPGLDAAPLFLFGAAG